MSNWGPQPRERSMAYYLAHPNAQDSDDAEEDEFEALNLPPVPCGVAAGSLPPGQTVYTWDQLIAFALEARGE